MGKQKSFIIVSLSFIGFILIILLVKVITSGTKETNIKFLSQEYVMEVGKEKSLAPEVYASGDVDDLDFNFTTDRPDIISLNTGTYSKGIAAVTCWSFTELDENGVSQTVDTKYPYNKNDKITITDGYWTINGEKTTYKAVRNYTATDIAKHVGPTASEIQIECYILNGIQTTYPYNESIKPERNEETGTWFINGHDTGYTYKCIQVTIKGQSIGSAKLTMTGTIKGKEYTASTIIKVANPDPASITLSAKYNKGLIYVQKGLPFTIDYQVNAKEGSVASPLQDVEYKIKDSTVVSYTNNNLTANELGNTTITITASRSSFVIGKYETRSITATVIVVETLDDELISKINAVYNAINEIGTVTKSDKSKEKLDNAKIAIEALQTFNEKYANNKFVINFDEYAKKFNQFLTLRVKDAINAINAIGEVSKTESCKKLLDAATNAIEAVRDIDEKYVSIDTITNYQDYVTKLEQYNAL